MTNAEPPLQHPFLPYGRQSIDQDDIDAVVDVLKSDWLTTGPTVDRFEGAFARFTGAQHAVAVSNGTAALHCAMAAAGVGPGDEVIVPTITFVATANAAVYQGATPVFCDVDPDTLLIDPAKAEALVTPRTKALVGVDYAGQPCDWDALRAIADAHDLTLIDDACHALGGAYKGRPVGTLADLNTFSFHPVKHMTTGEGGMITTDDPRLAQRMRVFRNHGITTDHRQRAESGSWRYEMTGIGYNYRMSDIQAALGTTQLDKVEGWVRRRQLLASTYEEALATTPGVEPLATGTEAQHAYHLFVVRFDEAKARDEAFERTRSAGIGTNVHYAPVHLHPYYRSKHGTAPGDCPIAESMTQRILSLPIFPNMEAADAPRVVSHLT